MCILIFYIGLQESFTKSYFEQKMIGNVEWFIFKRWSAAHVGVLNSYIVREMSVATCMWYKVDCSDRSF